MIKKNAKFLRFLTLSKIKKQSVKNIFHLKECLKVYFSILFQRNQNRLKIIFLI